MCYGINFVLIYTILSFLFTETKDIVKQNGCAIVNITQSMEVPGIDCCYQMHLTCAVLTNYATDPANAAITLQSECVCACACACMCVCVCVCEQHSQVVRESAF